MKRNGHKNGVQIYKCWQCGRQFLGGDRLSGEGLWKEYVTLRQTYSQMADKHGCSVKTIQRKIDRYRSVAAVHTPRRVVVVMDTTYWGRDFGVMLFKDALTGEDLLWYFVKTETVAMYVKGISTLLAMGYEIIGMEQPAHVVRPHGQRHPQHDQHHRRALLVAQVEAAVPQRAVAQAQAEVRR